LIENNNHDSELFEQLLDNLTGKDMITTNCKCSES